MRNNKRSIVRLLLVLLALSVLMLVGCDKYNKFINPHEHTLSYYEGKDATCTENGYKAYEACTECEYTTYTEISALGHDFTATYHPTNAELHSTVCKRCAQINESEEHDWHKIAPTEPTCTEYGSENYVCSVCKMSKLEKIEPLGHDYSGKSANNGDAHATSCIRCSSTALKEHSWVESEPTTATCEDDGIQAYTCSDCGAVKSEIVEALGHDYSTDYQPNGDVHSIICSRCQQTKEDGTHDWQEGNIVLAPTCTEVGICEMICTVCSATKLKGLVSLGHEYGDTYIPSGDTHSRKCIRCSSLTDSNPHEWQAGEVITQPKCDADGLQRYYCTVCNAEKTVVLDPIAHTPDTWTTILEPTALDAGERILKCAECKNQIGSERIPADVESMPRLYFEGEYEKATAAKNEVDVSVSYINPNGQTFDSYASIKVQGASSAAYAKKNYTVKLFKDAEHDSKYKIDLGWGKENKYVIKANWVDFSGARNVASCRLWGDLVQSRPTSENQKRLAALKTNGGAIDGFPIAVYMNGAFHGIYTLNVPKDEWMFGMGEKDENGNKSQTEALIAADDWNHTCFRSFIDAFVEQDNGDILSTDEGWELRYCGSDDYSWVADSFNALIRFCQNNNGAAFKSGISQYLDVDAAIDYLIFMYANCMHDNASKNMLWATYDGKTWIPSVYDQDGTFGQYWDGKRLENANRFLPTVINGRIDVNINYGPNIIPEGEPNFILWDKMWNNFAEEILARYNELRKTTLSVDNMIAELREFEEAIPESVFEAELVRWEAERAAWFSTWDYTKYHYDYMYQWVADRMYYYDIAMQSIADFIK